MRILFVAMSNSIHTVRWIKQLTGCGWDLHLFPSWADELHAELQGVTVHNALRFRRPPALDPSVKINGWWLPMRQPTLKAAYHYFPKFMDKSRRLARVIKRVQPDIVHSLEIQHGGYITMHAKRILKNKFPTWIVTNWGSDTYLYSRLSRHEPMLRNVFAASDYYDCECQRDVPVARSLGFQGGVLPVLPNTGGFDLDHLATLRAPGKTSERKIVLLKGYQDMHGRALCGVRALALCADVLIQRGLEAVLYCAYPEVQTAAELVTRETGLKITIQRKCSHEEMLRWHGKARMSIGLAISDGVSTSFLEALAMGSFPIQSHTACADEWITSGESGMLVPPEDPHIIAEAIRKAATDDALVDQAAEINARTAKQRLDYATVQTQVINAYKEIAAKIGVNAGAPVANNLRPSFT